MTRNSGVFLFEQEKQWEDAGNGAQRQIMGYDDSIMMVKVKFGTGDFGAPHRHPHSQVTFVAEGKFEFTVDGKTSIVSKGDGLRMEPDVLHSCRCLEAGLLIDCFSPMRDDFLK